MADPVLDSPDNAAPDLSIDYDEIAAQRRRQANINYLTSLDREPTEAARSVELSDATGAPASFINTDVPGFEREHKSALSSSVIARNNHLQEYLADDPIAAQMSHDDIGPLDKASESIDKLSNKSALQSWLESNSIQRSFMRGFGDEPFDTEKFYHGYSSSRPSEIEWAASHPVEGAIVGAAGQAVGLGELGMEGLSRVTSGLMSMGYDGMSAVFGEPFARDVMAMAEMRMMRGDAGIASGGGDLPLKRTLREQLEHSTFTPERLEDIQNRAKEAGIDPKTIEAESLSPEERAKATNDFILKNADKFQQLFHGMKVADNFVGAGEEPPPHIDPLIDAGKEAQIREDLQNLKQAMSDADATQTKGLSPDYFAKYAELHNPGDIGIDSEKIRDLYGETEPEEGDGKLGWIPDLAGRVDRAEGHAGDIYVPKSDFLARTDTSVVNDIQDGLRLRDGGMTVDETKVGEPKQVVDDPVAAVRGGAGMEPLAMAGDRKITLERTKSEEGAHTISIKDDTGKEIGGILVSEQKGGKQIYIENIQAGAEANQFYQPNFLGYSSVRDIKQQLKSMFPNAETITGQRATGARYAGREPTYIPPRDVAMPEVKLALEEDPQHFRDMLSAMWEPVYESERGVGVSALFGTPEKGLAANSPMGQIVLSELRRLVPGVESDIAHGLTFSNLPGRKVSGAYLPDIRSIIVALGTDELGIARHEAIHALRDLGLFSEEEWSHLESASVEFGWRERFGIEDRYAHVSENIKTEESIAEAYRAWAAGKLDVADPTVFQRIKDFLEGLRKQVLDHLGIDRKISWDEIFDRVEKGEIGARTDADFAEGTQPRAAIEGEPIEKGKTVGVTEAFMNRQRRLIEQRNKEDYEAALKRGQSWQTTKLKPEFQARLKQVKDEVRQELVSHPVYGMDKFMSESGMRLDSSKLTKDQRDRLPKEYQKRGGLDGDTIAPAFGFDSGDALVERLAMITEERQRKGLTQSEYFNKVAEAETNRRMRQEFGGKPHESLEDARDQALSETQMRLVHEDTMRGAMQLGIEPKITLDDMKAIAKKAFDDTPIGEIKSSRLLQKAGATAMKIAEENQKRTGKALQKAYQLLQQRQQALLLAKEAIGYEKARKAFDRTARFFGRTPTAETAKRIDTEYYNWIQHTLARLGYPLQRSIGELNAAVQLHEHKTLQAFVEAKRSEMRELNVPDFVLDPTWPGSKKIGDLTHREFQDINDMIKSMEHEGRDERYLVLQGQQIPIDEAKEKMIEQIKNVAALEAKTRAPDRPRKIRDALKGYWWQHITPETMWDRLDQGNARGLFHQLLSYPAARAVNDELQMMDKYKRKFKELEFDDMDRKVENTLFKDPNTGAFVEMRRRNVLRVLADWGNNSNIQKMTAGWNVDPDAVQDFLRRNTTRKDWDNAQKMGDIFEEAFKEAEKMSMEATGVGIKRVPIEPFTDPFGVPRRGWYSPVDYDPYLPGKGAATGKNVLELPGYYRATTDQRWSKERTGKIAPTSLDLDVIPQRMSQIIHDTAVRPTLIQMSKILHDEGVQRAIIAGYGKAQMDEMKSWLQDMANRRNVDSANQKAMNDVMGFFRANIIGNLIGFNPSTVMKHTPTALVGSITRVGAFSFLKASMELLRTDNATQMRLFKQAYDESKEVQGRMHNYGDLLRGQGESFQFEQGKISWLRELNLKMGAAPVAFGDFMSVLPTYWAARSKALRDGASMEEAIDIGNAAIREAHGTSRLTGQPGVMRGTSELGRFYTSLYGFFSHILQQQYKLSWKARDLLNGQKPLDIEGHWAPHMIGKFMSYFIIPAVVEELVTPYTNEERDSWGMKAAKGIGLGLSSSLTQVRDLVRSFINPGQGGLLDSAFGFPGKLVKDLEGPRNREQAAKIIKDAIGATGSLTGLTNAQEGRTAEYITRYSQGLERPRGPWDVAVGLRYGKTDKHSRTFDEWWKHTVEGKR